MQVKLVVELEVVLRVGDTVESMQQVWTNNKVTARVAELVEQAALLQVVGLSVKLVKEN